MTNQESNRNLKDVKKDLGLNAVISHVKKMRVPADHTRTKCVDGRYKVNEAAGAIAIHGGHLGISMALLALDFTPQKSFDLVYDFAVKDNNFYCWHTDTHARE